MYFLDDILQFIWCFGMKLQHYLGDFFLYWHRVFICLTAFYVCYFIQTKFLMDRTLAGIKGYEVLMSCIIVVYEFYRYGGYIFFIVLKTQCEIIFYAV